MRASTMREGLADSVAAIDQLAALEDHRVDDMLLRLASGDVEFSNSQSRAYTLRVLAEQGMNESAQAIAGMLVPHEAITVRQAAAEALQALKCDSECMYKVLHYLERVSKGEPNAEDKALRLDRKRTFPKDFIEAAAMSIRSDQSTLYQSLFDIVRANDDQALSILVDTYGLGGGRCAEFAYWLIAETQMGIACGELAETARILEIQMERKGFSTERELAENARSAAGCSR